MTVSKGRRKRNSAIIALFLPAILFLWIFGWSLYWIGHQRESRKPKPSSSPKEEDHISLIPAVLEGPSEIEN